MTQDTVTKDDQKLLFAPVTNLGCESEIAWLDNRLKFSGGTTSVLTLSHKNTICTNKYLLSDEFTLQTKDNRKKEWKWARVSDESKQVKALTLNFLRRVKEANQMSLRKKEELKKKKHIRINKLIDECKGHGGPLTASNISLVNVLTSDQLISEISFLRVTTSPNIRQQRRIKLENGRFKMERFSTPELRFQVKNAIKPESEVDLSVDSLLKDVFKQN